MEILKIALGVALGLYIWELFQQHVLRIKKYSSNMLGQYPYTVTEDINEMNQKTKEGFKK